MEKRWQPRFYRAFARVQEHSGRTRPRASAETRRFLRAPATSLAVDSNFVFLFYLLLTHPRDRSDRGTTYRFLLFHRTSFTLRIGKRDAEIVFRRCLAKIGSSRRRQRRFCFCFLVFFVLDFSGARFAVQMEWVSRCVNNLRDYGFRLFCCDSAENNRNRRKFPPNIPDDKSHIYWQLFKS